MTKYRELLAGGPKGCDFSGLEQGTLGMPLEQLGPELTAVERQEEKSFPESLNGKRGREEGSWEGKCVEDSVFLSSSLNKGSTTLALQHKADGSFQKTNTTNIGLTQFSKLC